MLWSRADTRSEGRLLRILPWFDGNSASAVAFWQAVGLLAVAFIAYIPLWRAGFIWDDDSMLTANPLIREPSGLYQFWLTTHALDYWPVTSTSLWLEWRLWGMNPLGYHLTNLALHFGTVLLFWAVLRRLRVPGAWLGALLFAIHPLNVESVTWIAQRKNLLALLFYLLAILLFIKAAEANDWLAIAAKARTRLSSALRNRWYALSLASFVLAMLSKGSVATLPAVLWGILIWQRRPAWRDVIYLGPFFLVAVLLAGVNVWFQRHGLSEVIRTAGGLERLAGAGAVVGFYFCKAVWPLHLVFIYPQWKIDPHQLVWWLPLLGVLAVTGVLAALARRESACVSANENAPGAAAPWARSALFAWLYFCLSLLPVVGFTDVYFMKFSLVADHYTHVALLGIAAWLGFALTRLYESSSGPARSVFGLTASAIVIGFVALTWRQNLPYRDGIQLYRSILAQNPGSWMVHSNLGQLLAAMPGAGGAARAEFEAAVRLKPDYAEAQNNLGVALSKNMAELPEAISHYREALRLKPNYALAHRNLAAALMKTDAPANEILYHFAEAVRLEPSDVEARRGLAAELSTLPGRAEEAVAQYEAALALSSADASLENDLAVELAKIPGRLPEAITHLERALRLAPEDADLEYNLGNQLMKIPGRVSEAVSHYEQATRLRPGFTAAHFNLAVACARSGRMPEAVEHLQRVVALDPSNRAARDALQQMQATGR